jgi:hypothetical protein
VLALGVAVFLVPSFVCADATPVMRAVDKSIAAMNLETMRCSIGYSEVPATIIAAPHGALIVVNFLAGAPACQSMRGN